MSLNYLGLLDTVLLSSVGSIITPCNLCEVLPTVTVQCDSPSKPSPTNTDVMETVGASPFLQCLFPDGEGDAHIVVYYASEQRGEAERGLRASGRLRAREKPVRSSSEGGNEQRTGLTTR
jgi:hypothetical protein